ncbi:hypothetical protein BH10ACT11_BH10ACT11_14210 [soil metagenome]
MIRRHLTYANVTSTIALCLALGIGGAYAAGHIGSSQIKNDSLRSDDLRDGVAVKGKDVKKNTLTGNEIQERRLAASGIGIVAGAEGAGCTPSPTETDCLSKSVSVRQTSRLLAVATGDQVGDGVAAAATCQVQFDGSGGSLFSHPGELSNNTAGTAANGFARTSVSEPLQKGSHQVALVCERDGPNAVRIDSPTLAIIAIGSR